jgi:asparagine synthase (glutamine-hydrolysing)
MEILRPKYRTDLVPTSLAAGNETSSTGRSVIEYLNSIESRVVLSGIGGDEVMGGVATPLPELADLFVQANVIEFCRQATRWCLALRQPFAHLLGQVLSTFLPKKLVKTKADPWVNPHFQRRYRDALAGYSRRSTLFRPRPSLTMNLSALNNLRRQLACSSLSPELPCEKRYPYLDRDLLEFIYSIPRSQLVRPGQRRSLMRRAFRGIVPDEIIDRKRKAFAVRSPLFAFATNDPLRGELKEGMLSDLFGYVDFRRLAKTIEIARQGGEAPMAALVRTITLEHWLRHLSKLNAIELNQRVRDGKTMPKSKKGWHRVTADTYR